MLRTSLRHPLIQSERRLSSSLAGMPFSNMYTGTPSVDAYEIALYRLGGYTGSANHAAAMSALRKHHSKPSGGSFGHARQLLFACCYEKMPSGWPVLVSRLVIHFLSHWMSGCHRDLSNDAHFD